MDQAGATDDHRLSRRALLVAGASTTAAGVLAGPAQAKAKPKARKHVAAPKPTGLPAPRPIYAQQSNPADLGVLEAASLLQAGLLSSAELTAACQSRIAARNGPVSFTGSSSEINAWIRLYPDRAAKLAAAADERLASARRSRRLTPELCGVPIGLKDLYAVDGLPVTASSKVLGGDQATGTNAIAGNIASGDSTAWERLAAAGMVLVGHTHTDEFAFLAVTPQCGNPWNTTLITGGSSGGSAAALASRMVTAALGSDTLGSLRVPAAFCGVSSIKPTFGIVPTHGVIPLCWSLDTCGPMARSVADAALMLDALAGADPSDPSSEIAERPPTRYPTLPRSGSKPLHGVRIGVPTNLGAPDTGPAQILDRTHAELQALGATLVPLAVPADPFGEVGLLESYIDALSYHQQWYPSKLTEYKPPAAEILSAITALNLTALDYLSIMRQRAAYQAQWKQTFAAGALDAVVMPVSLADPVARDALASSNPLTNPENGKLLTYTFSYLGFPVVTVPGGTSTATGLPVGIQIAGAPFTEPGLIQLAIDLQAHYPHFRQTPSFR